MRESGWLKRIPLSVVFSSAIGFAACEQAGSLATGPHEIELAGKPPAIDVSGAWSWSEEGKGLIPEELAFPEPFPLLNGRVSGRAIHFDFSDPICPYVGDLTLEGGFATAMNGTGRCGPLGPRDHFKTVTWQATRLPG